ncbi:MAG TPA: GNAT family N-acetyltransferase [Egicoccus sp.]|nr:GNAT family N-acetyltransferase [Egicoccus sp.]HSK22468.1 GNAT family N-acetyltransferase [Egicoccus sp.]
MTPTLRSGRERDLPGIREVCIRTGAAGQDATGSYPDDGILPDLYAEPYVRLEPDLVRVADEAGRVVGYVLGAADTDAFVVAWREQWLPIAARRHPDPSAEPVTPYEQLVALLHRPEAMRTPWVDRYPAHLHVDLLPEAQGHGVGRALVERFCQAVEARGACGVHLGVAAQNVQAQAFYRRIGFEALATTEGAVWFGRRW